MIPLNVLQNKFCKSRRLEGQAPDGYPSDGTKGIHADDGDINQAAQSIRDDNNAFKGNAQSYVQFLQPFKLAENAEN